MIKDVVLEQRSGKVELNMHEAKAIRLEIRMVASVDASVLAVLELSIDLVALPMGVYALDRVSYEGCLVSLKLFEKCRRGWEK